MGVDDIWIGNEALSHNLLGLNRKSSAFCVACVQTLDKKLDRRVCTQANFAGPRKFSEKMLSNCFS